MDAKIPALTRAFQRIARIHPDLFIYGLVHPRAQRFIKLFRARNRRTRVLMRRAQKAMERSSAYLASELPR